MSRVSEYAALIACLWVAPAQSQQADDQAPFAQRMRAAILRLDADGKISRAEFTGQAMAFSRMDENKDGFLTIDEMPTAPPIPVAVQPTRRIMAMDKDADGKVSRAEFTGRAAVFDRLDANKDGFLEKSEIPNPDEPAKPKT